MHFHFKRREGGKKNRSASTCPHVHICLTTNAYSARPFENVFPHSSHLKTAPQKSSCLWFHRISMFWGHSLDGLYRFYFCKNLDPGFLRWNSAFNSVMIIHENSFKMFPAALCVWSKPIFCVNCRNIMLEWRWTFQVVEVINEANEIFGRNTQLMWGV